jgi:hypothetical protein
LARDARKARCPFHAARLKMKNAAHSHALLVCISSVSGNKSIVLFCSKCSAARGHLALTMPWNMAALVDAVSVKRVGARFSRASERYRNAVPVIEF